MANDSYRVLSKSISAILICSCVILSSPGFILADDLTSTTSPSDASLQSAQSSDSMDVQPVQAQDAATDSVPVSDLVSTASSSDSPIFNSDILQTTSPSDSSALNNTTGDTSQNNSATTSNNNTDITNQNYAQVFNDSLMSADTGTNTANYNTGSGIITTQKAEGDGELLNVINENVVQVGDNSNQCNTDSDCPTLGVVCTSASCPQNRCVSNKCTVVDSAANQSTGSDSNNNSDTNINNELTVRNVNDANVINRITANINSGNNDANFNTGHGIITTGAANLGLNFFSLANANLLGSQNFYANLQNIYNDYTGNIDLSQELSSNSSPLSSVLLNAANNSTGQNSSNQSITNVNDQTTITNQNSGNLNNEIDANVTSGKNQANYNTGTGSVVSGAVNSSVNVMNFMNSNITSGKWMLKTLNVFGNWQGDLDLPSMPEASLTATASPSDSSAGNSSTGNGSNNSVNSGTNNSLSVTNNNQAVINNNVTMNTDAGNNDSSYNGGSGIVAVGAANSETNEMNVANMNVTGNSWWLVVVNRFGNWSGTAVGAPDAVAIKSTGIATVLTPMQSGVDVVNNPTGSDSNNTAGGTFSDSTGITNTNQAQITNTLNINAISGENQAQRNSGHGYVETGDIRGANNIINFANSNITVGNWVVVVVNVFGDWNGNLVFNTPGFGTILPIGGSLACPIFNSSSSISSSNNTTGANSSNNSGTTTDTNTSSTNNNNVNLNNTTSASTTTGQNSADYNTGSGSVSTGQAQTGSSVSNQANTNSISSDQSGGSGNSSSSNNSTGSGSTNNSGTTSTANANSTNNNDTTQNNNLSGTNNTGQNSSNYNTGDGSVDTSWATTFLNLRNQANDNQLSLGALTNEFDQTPSAPGSQSLIPDANSAPQVCPGVTIQVSPGAASIKTGGTQTFTAVADDPSGNPVRVQPAFTWTATGGTIDSQGVFTAGSAAGSFAVTATASYGNQGSANVTITDPVAAGGGTISYGGGGGGGGGFSLGSSHIKGDYNNDGKVDDLDFSILMSMWGEKRTGILAEDAGDGIAGDEDFSIVMSNWTHVLLAKI